MNITQIELKKALFPWVLCFFLVQANIIIFYENINAIYILGAIQDSGVPIQSSGPQSRGVEKVQCQECGHGEVSQP